MSTFPRLLAVLAVVAPALGANAQTQPCPEALPPRLATHAKVAGARGGPPAQVVSAACKVWPFDERLMLAAVAYDVGRPDQKTLVVAATDTRTGAVVAIDRDEITEDAVSLVVEHSLGIDTARYQLAPGVRAFGVHFHSGAPGASCGEGYWEDELTLYVIEGAVLRPVLTSLPLTHARASRGCFGSGGAGHELEWDEAKLTLAIAPTKSHGFADLQVTAAIRRNGDAAAKPRIERVRLQYDGRTYTKPVDGPWWLGP